VVGILTGDLAETGLLRSRDIEGLQDAGEGLEDAAEETTTEEELTALDLLVVVLLLTLVVVVLGLALGDVGLDGGLTLSADVVEVLGLLLGESTALSELTVRARLSQNGRGEREDCEALHCDRLRRSD
jgi:hypothetical protein